MNVERKQEVKKILQHEKIRVILCPLVVATILYGIQLSLFPAILETYGVYALIDDFVVHWEVGGLFIILPILMVVAFKMHLRIVLLVASILLLMLWSVFTIAFLLSPPPNTVWIFAALMMYLAFSLTRRV